MIIFDNGGMQFNYRVAGVALQENGVLLNSFEGGDYWFLPGGRIELGEASIEALKREMREELGEEIQVGRLLWVVESFFESEQRIFHEVALYFLMMFAQGSPLYQRQETFEGQEGSLKLICAWHALDDLERLTLYPPFLRMGLRALPEYAVHVLDDEREG